MLKPRTYGYKSPLAYRTIDFHLNQADRDSSNSAMIMLFWEFGFIYGQS